MQKISGTVQINASVETVFGALTHVQNNVHWIKSVIQVELLDELPLKVGFRFRETGGFMGVNTTDEKRVIEYDRPKTFGFVGEFLENSTHYTLNAIDDNTTEVTVTLAGTPPRGTPALIQRQVLKQAVKRIKEDLTRLGAMLEKQEAER